MGAMTYTKPVTTIKVNAGGADLTLTIDGAADATAEDFASELFDIARIGFASAFTGSFQENILEQLEYAFEARQKERAAESEYDIGFRVGMEAGVRQGKNEAWLDGPVESDRQPDARIEAHSDAAEVSE